MYHSEEDARKAQDEFERVYGKKENPEDMKSVKIGDLKLKLVDLISKTGLVESNSEIRRLVEQGAVKIDNIQKSDFNESIKISDGMVVQIGKRRFIKIIK
jgi:tyrosyl-tRNA synthetase